MDNNHTHPLLGVLYLIVSIFGTIYAWVSIIALKDLIGIVAGFISTGAGIMAIRYYYFATKEKKKNLK